MKLVKQKFFVNDKLGEEEPYSYYDDINIDIETTAMAVNKILELDEDLPHELQPNDGSMNIKTVNSNSGEMDGLEPCTKYALEVTVVYNNNATAASEQKMFNTVCTSGTPCDEDEWQETLEIIQEAKDDALEIVATLRGCQDDKFLLSLTCNHMSDNCKDYTGPGNYDNGKFEVVLSNLAFCTSYEMVLGKESTSIQRDFVSIQNPNMVMNLTDMNIEMKHVKFGQYPSLTEGSVTASWTHHHACISTYGIRLCQEERCGQSFKPAEHCQPYRLVIRPDTRH